MPEHVFDLFDEYAVAYCRGERPVVDEYLDRAGSESGLLAALLDEFLCRIPVHPPTPNDVHLLREMLAAAPAVNIDEIRPVERAEKVGRFVVTSAIAGGAAVEAVQGSAGDMAFAGRGGMDLRERLNTARATHVAGERDPFADLKNRIHFAVIGDLGPQLYNVTMDPDDLRERVLADVRDQLAQETGISRDDRQRIALEIADDILGHGPLERLLADDSVTEIMVNGPNEIWIERQGRLYETPVRFNDESHLRRIINKMVAQVGRRIDDSTPMVDARLPDGSRVNAIIPPLSLSGPLVTIRKFGRKRLTLDDMIKLGTLNQETVEFLQRCIRAQLNMLISGGTGSGKTTLLNALSTAIPDEERIVTIEDAAELRLNQRHVLRLESRPRDLAGENEIPIRELVRNSLRMRPDRIIVGEVRGAEALDMLQAMNTGHDGSLSTIHANSPRDALARVETMVLMAGYDLPVRAIREQSSAALDGIIHLERLEDGSRRVVSITEVQRMESDVIALQELFKFQIDELTADGTIVGGLRPTGLHPTFVTKFEKRGIALPLGLFHAHEPEFGHDLGNASPVRHRASGS